MARSPDEIERQVARVVKINAMAGHHYGDELIESLRRDLTEDVDMQRAGDEAVEELKTRYGR